MVSGVQTNRATVLHVDDDNHGRLLTSTLLRDAGFDVREAASGAEALQQAAAHPDLILLDVQLGDTDGFEVCKGLKAHPATRNIPVMLFSGVHVLSQARVHGLDCGADAYLVKPVEPSVLVAELKALLRIRQAAQVAKAAQFELAAIVESSTDAIIAETADGIITTWNAGAEKLYGYQAAEVVGKPVALLFPPERESEFHEILRRLSLGEQIPTRETVRLRKGGERVDVSVGYSRIEDDRGRMVGVVAIARDLSTRKQVEQRMALDAFLLANVRDAVIVTDLEGVITYWNEGATRLFGWRTEESLGLKYVERLPEATRSLMAECFHAVAEGHEWTGEWEHCCKDSSVVWLDGRLGRLDNSEGEPIGILVLAHDITERKRLEEQYRQTQKMEAIGRLAGGVAHDFNNLLTIINGYSELVLDQLPPAEATRELLMEIKKAGQRATSLTRQLLAFSRQQVLVPQVLDLNDVITDTEKMLRRLIGEDINLATNLDPNLQAVKADPGQIEQVLLNLAVNARDAMPKGGVLSIHTRNLLLGDDYPEIPPGRYALLAVSDTGHGIAPEVRDRIFEPFFTTKPVGMGTGLGLATVFGIVKQSGGHITLTSAPGSGTSFQIYLPTTNQPRTSGKLNRSLHERPKGNETVLLVEDDASLRGLGRSALQAQGYRVLEAGNGCEAIRLCEEQSDTIDLVVTDVVMPEMGGGKLAEWLAGHRPETKVLFVSGYTDDAMVRHGLQEAEIDFLEKPFSIGKFTRKVRELLDRPEEGA